MIKLSESNRNQRIELTIDGITQPDLHPGDEVHITSEVAITHQVPVVLAVVLIVEAAVPVPVLVVAAVVVVEATIVAVMVTRMEFGVLLLIKTNGQKI